MLNGCNLGNLPNMPWFSLQTSSMWSSLQVFFESARKSVTEPRWESSREHDPEEERRLAQYLGNTWENTAEQVCSVFGDTSL